MSADPGATPVGARAPAPDLARGGMLLLIALANVHFYVYGHGAGPRGYPSRVEGADRWVTVAQMTLVDGRAYPMFGFLFGYGIVQLAWRRGALGRPVGVVTRLVRRRGAWMVAIGVAHGVLLWSGDIVSAYGLLAVVLAGVLVRGSPGTLYAVAVVGVVLLAPISAASGLSAPDDEAGSLLSVSLPDPAAALVARVAEVLLIAPFQGFAVFGAVALGAAAARRRVLDDPARHRPMLVGVVVGGLLLAVLGGLPLALMTAQFWPEPGLAAVLLAATVHGIGGYAGGLGYAALFGLLAARMGGRPPGPVARAVQACGQRSLSCYLAQSVAFVALLPAWTSGLGGVARLWQAALVGFGVWLVILLVAAASDRAGRRGPAEVLLRRLTYGPTRPDERTALRHRA